MKLTKYSIAIAASLGCAMSAQGALLYHYAFETADSTVNSGTGAAIATAVGSVTSGAGTGSSGFFADFDGGNTAAADHIDVNIAADAITLGNFQVTIDLNDSAATDFDDFFGLSASGGFNLAFERTGANDRLTIYEVGNGSGALTTTNGDLTAGSWNSFSLVGTTSGADASLEIFANGVSRGSVTYTGGASAVIQDVRIGGRVGANNRYIDGGIDEVKIYDVAPVPEPSSTALLGLGGLALILRRRK